jgi:hypothetical protein
MVAFGKSRVPLFGICRGRSLQVRPSGTTNTFRSVYQRGSALSTTHQRGDEHHEEHHDEDEEQYFRDRCRSSRDPRESEDGGDDGDDQKNECPRQHIFHALDESASVCFSKRCRNRFRLDGRRQQAIPVPQRAWAPDQALPWPRIPSFPGESDVEGTPPRRCATLRWPLQPSALRARVSLDPGSAGRSRRLSRRYRALRERSSSMACALRTLLQAPVREQPILRKKRWTWEARKHPTEGTLPTLPAFWLLASLSSSAPVPVVQESLLQEKKEKKRS